jgi:signal transduction histidine kinase
VSWALAATGWALAAALAWWMRRRLSLIADAEHELRGAATAIGLVIERSDVPAAVVRLQLERMAAGLADLAVAGGRRLADPGLDSGRLAQVLGNLAANAAEHGLGPVDVRATRRPEAVRLEIRNRNRPRELDGAGPGRGRGLRIAERAARELGGELRVETHDGQTRATLDLPAGGGAAPDASQAA